MNPVEIVDLAEQLRALGCSEFTVGNVCVKFTAGSVPLPQVAVREDTDHETAVLRAMNDTILDRAEAQGIGKPKFPGQS